MHDGDVLHVTPHSFGVLRIICVAIQGLQGLTQDEARALVSCGLAMYAGRELKQEAMRELLAIASSSAQVDTGTCSMQYDMQAQP